VYVRTLADRRWLHLLSVNRLTRQMSEVLILHLVSHELAILHLIVPTMSYLEILLDLTSQILCTHPIQFSLAESAKKIIDRLVVGVVYISRA
jgi:TRAP-type C4-dicarboxylate transport system permease large subunit